MSSEMSYRKPFSTGFDSGLMNIRKTIVLNGSEQDSDSEQSAIT